MELVIGYGGTEAIKNSRASAKQPPESVGRCSVAADREHLHQSDCVSDSLEFFGLEALATLITLYCIVCHAKALKP